MDAYKYYKPTSSLYVRDLPSIEAGKIEIIHPTTIVSAKDVRHLLGFGKEKEWVQLYTEDGSKRFVYKKYLEEITRDQAINLQYRYGISKYTI